MEAGRLARENSELRAERERTRVLQVDFFFFFITLEPRGE